MEEYALTEHAKARICRRRISEDAVGKAIQYGRKVCVRGATYYVVGRKEVSRLSRKGVDIREVEGVHVVCLPNGLVVTVYRNHDLRGIRAGRSPRGRHPKKVLWSTRPHAESEDIMGGVFGEIGAAGSRNDHIPGLGTPKSL